MAHELDLTTGTAAMAYIGQLPWHRLGRKLEEGAPLEEWITAAHMDYTLALRTCYYADNEGWNVEYPARKIVVREDTQDALADVSNRYKLVQPREILEFYRDLVAEQGFVLETAGALFGGRRYWALARTGMESKIGKNDHLKGYLLLATSCDGTLATTARFTSVRVVCNNTLTVAQAGAQAGVVRQRHTTAWNPAALKSQLGLTKTAWEKFLSQARKLASTTIRSDMGIELLVDTLGEPNTPFDDQPEPTQKAFTRIMDLFNGAGRGSDLATANGTAWGLLNAVTDYVDHEAKPRANAESRFMNSAFGTGESWKLKMQESLVREII